MLGQGRVWMLLKLLQEVRFVRAGDAAWTPGRREHQPQLPLLVQREIPLHSGGMNRELLGNLRYGTTAFHRTNDPLTQLQRIPSPTHRLHASL